MVKEIFKVILLLAILFIGIAAGVVRKEDDASWLMRQIASVVYFITVCLPLTIAWYSFIDKVLDEK